MGIEDRRLIYAAALLGLVVCLGSELLAAQTGARTLGVFDGQSDVGSVTPPGIASYDAKAGTYTVTAAGENLWSTADAFHFVWKKVSGDVELTADASFPEAAGEHNPHRKAVLMFRQTLDADGVYADAAVHGSGLTALQYRRTRSATTQDIELNIELPKTVRLEKRGDEIAMFLSMKGEPLHQVGASIKMRFDGQFYAGIGVCSHNKDAVEKAVFARLELKPPAPIAAGARMALYSTLQTIGIEDSFRRALVVATGREQMEAPNWSRDGASLLFTREGKIWKIGAEGGTPARVDTGALEGCGGSHGLSPDGKWLAVSCAIAGGREVRIYIVPSGGGTPRQVTANPWAWFHSWSPDGKTILFVRPDNGSLNLYAIPAEGGAEMALTSGNGVNDDPDYSADGKYIYFNSDRAGGTMQIWRMKADGSEPEQMTHDEFNNWTPHPSPDGKSVLILSYDKSVAGHLANKDVALRILTPADGKVRLLVNIEGGSGTDNVPNWAPDGSHFAFVSYQMLPEGEGGSSR
jgi:Tol biopolymer transport system component